MPVSLDFFPCDPNRNGFHYWPTILSTIRKNPHISEANGSIAAKVYRRTYSHNLFLSPGTEEYIPPFFREPFNKDVTDEYFYTSDITINAGPKMPSALHYGYLAVFNNLQWTPVAIGERKRNKIVFKNIGRNILYLPVFYRKEELNAIDYPFALYGDGSTQQFVPDTSHKITLNLYRKYPYNSRIDFSTYLSQIIVEGSEDSVFRRKDTVAILKFDYDKYYIDQKIETDREYRYLRFNAIRGKFLQKCIFGIKMAGSSRLRQVL